MDNVELLKKDDYLYSAIQEGNEPPTLNNLQSKLKPHVESIEVLLWLIWLITLAAAIYKLIQISINKNS